MRNVLAIRMSMAICTSLLILTGCGGGGSPSVGQTKFDRVLPVPGVGAGTNFSFDIADVDTRTNRLYFTDRNNKSVDVYDTRSNTLVTQIMGGFFGVSPLGNDHSGPDGLNVIPQAYIIMVGDVNSVKIIDTSTDKVVGRIGAVLRRLDRDAGRRFRRRDGPYRRT